MAEQEKDALEELREGINSMMEDDLPKAIDKDSSGGTPSSPRSPDYTMSKELLSKLSNCFAKDNIL